MGTIEIIKELCDKKGISLAQLEKDLNFGNGSIAKSKTVRSDRLFSIAKYFDVTMEYLVTGDEREQYYLNEETADLAQALYEDPNQRVLFNASRNARPEDLQMAADLLNRLKETNPNG